tara:strand:- start:520 stop:909 length:390 start_codon:yes stop_codon:yes gene_type:complete
MKKKIIISVLVVAALLLWTAPIKAADSKDVIIGTIIGGIIGSEIQKDKQKAQQYIPHTTQSGIIYLPDGSIIIPSNSTKARENIEYIAPFNPIDNSLQVGDWRWDRYSKTWRYRKDCSKARDYSRCRLN